MIEFMFEKDLFDRREVGGTRDRYTRCCSYEDVTRVRAHRRGQFVDRARKRTALIGSEAED